MSLRKSSGFTLVELMVVIAVVAIFAAIATPSYQELIDRYRLQKASDDVISLVSSARSGSVKLHRQVVVSFANGATWCAGANAAAQPTGGERAQDANTCSCGTPSTCLVEGEVVAIPVGKHQGVVMTNAPGALVFDGAVGATTGLATRTVSLQSPAGKFTADISITPLGQATACIGGAGSTQTC